jgi:hypothetical protein
LASPGKRKPYKPNTKTMVLTYLLQKACQKIEYYALKMNYLKQNIQLIINQQFKKYLSMRLGNPVYIICNHQEHKENATE